MIYEFECVSCAKNQEIEMRLWEYEEIISKKVAPPSCPNCDKPLRKIITKAPSFKLLGNGWAKDGYSMTENETRKMTNNIGEV